MRQRRCLTSLGVVGLAVIMLGWSTERQSEGPSGDQPSAATATVTGAVKFQGTAPAMPTIDMSAEAVCHEQHANPPREQTVEVNGDGTLKNVFVYVKAGLDESVRHPAPRDSVWIDQVNCRYHPHVLGARVGQQIAIRNSDPLLHNVNAKATQNRGFNISQPVQGMVSSRRFRIPEVMVLVGCDVHAWMGAYVGILPHPFFATTGDNGSFAIPDLPPGTYTIEAWHEKYGTQTAEVTVGEGESKAIEFTFGDG